MFKVCIFGGNGKIGTALSHYLHDMGYIIDCCDVAGRNLYGKQFNCMADQLPSYDYDMFISCAPTHFNELIRGVANINGIKYVDFGGDEDHRQIVEKDKDNCQHGVMTGIGLAPGFANMVASHLTRNLLEEGIQPHNVKIVVGGISDLNNENILGWLPTWSVEGLLQSYLGDCYRLRNGKIEECSAMTPELLETVYLNSTTSSSVFEIFHNSGGISHTLNEMLSYGVENCDYYTLRWAGHCRVMETILDMAAMGFTEQQLIDHIYEISNTGGKDTVICDIHVSDYIQDHIYQKNFTFTPNHMFTAMQIATALPAAYTIDNILRDHLVGYITYKDIDVGKIIEQISEDPKKKLKITNVLIGE